jgi:predicted secreted protein
LVERLVRDQEVAGSSPVAPTTVVRIPIVLVALLGLLGAGMLACAVASLVVWSGLCTGPRVPDATHTVLRNCHGAVVYGTPLADDLWNWILPTIFFALFVPATALIVALKVRIARSANTAVLGSGPVAPTRPRKLRRILLAVAAAAVLVVVAWRAIPVPSNQRDWIVPHSRLPAVEIAGSNVTIRGVRNFRYDAAGTVTRAVWEDPTYDLEHLTTAWLGVSPFGTVPGAGHVFVSFGFDDGRHVAISVEARREAGEDYGVISGLFRAFELIYVIGDERDVVALRTNVWQDDVYLYPVRAAAADLRAAFLDMVVRAGALNAQPEFYDTIGNSCSSNLARHVNRIAPGRVPPSYKVLFAAFSDELAHDLGLLDVEGGLAAARERFHVNARAAGDVDAGDFSARIRAAGPAAPQRLP